MRRSIEIAKIFLSLRNILKASPISGYEEEEEKFQEKEDKGGGKSEGNFRFKLIRLI